MSDIINVDRCPDGEGGDVGPEAAPTEDAVRSTANRSIRLVASLLSPEHTVPVEETREQAEIAIGRLRELARSGAQTAEGTALDLGHLHRAIAFEFDLIVCGVGPATTQRFRLASELVATAVGSEAPVPVTHLAATVAA